MADSKKYNGSTWEHSLRKFTTATDTFTTLPAVLYPNDTTAAVGLKGDMSRTGTPTPSSPIQPSECGERAANLFDYNAYFNSTFVPYNEFFEYATIQLLPNTTYTLSTSIAEYEYTTRETPFIVATTNQVPTTAGGGISNISPITITTENDGILKLYKRISGRAIQPTKDLFDNGAWLMLNTGSTALPYEPYGYKIPISSANTITPVYLGEVETTRKIKKVTLTGNETFTKNDNQSTHYLYYASRATILPSSMSITPVLCNELPVKNDAPQTVIGISANNTFKVVYFNFGADVMNAQPSGNTVEGLKEYLSAQYAAGTPVTVWYVLATETTGIVNEPLRKIGDYADTVSVTNIPTTTGKDSFDVLTTLKPSEVELTYTGWHDAECKEWDGSDWQ